MENECNATGPECAGNDNAASPSAGGKSGEAGKEQGISILGSLALLIGYGAFVFLWIPFIGIFCILAMILGILLAIAGMAVSRVWQKSDMKVSRIALLLNLFVLFVALFIFFALRFFL